MSESLASTGDPDPIVGAIRWDAWYGETGPVTEVERSLGPRKFHHRLPFFATVVSDTTVSINGDSPAIMEREIAYAADMGLGYWAFLDYWEDPLLSIALRRYLAAADKRGVRYCLVEEGARLDAHGVAGWARLVEHFAHPDYQRVLDGRPLLFVFKAPERLTPVDFQVLFAASIAAGAGKPYVVLMGWKPEEDARTIATFGFDAVSAYAAGGEYEGEMQPYQQLASHVEQAYWGACARDAIATVTFATAGWDTRPRIEHPVSWYPIGAVPKPDPTPPAQQRPLIDAVTAQPRQLADHLSHAIDWTRRHRELNPANTVIIYAWNEHDEGGWLCPTLRADGGANVERLEAVRSVLRDAAGRPANPR